LVIVIKGGVKGYFYIFFERCDCLIAIERQKETWVNEFLSL
jgi:hypothetical protein